VGVAIATQYGRGLDDNDPHYLLPLYSALPAAARGGSWPGSRDRRRARLLAAAVLSVHALGALGGSFANLHPAIAAAERAELDAQRATVEGLERAGIRRVYDSDATGRVFTVLSGGRTIVSNPYEEIRPSFARAVDGAAAAAWWTRRRAPGLEAHFQALGARFTFHRVSRLGGAYGDFALVAPPVRELEPATLRVTASDGGDVTGRMTDRHGATLWSTGRPQRGGEWVQVDLGAVRAGRARRWLPGTYQEVPRGLRLEAPWTAPRGARSWTCRSTAVRSTGRRAGRSCACAAAGSSSAWRRRRRGISASRRRRRRSLGVDDPGALRLRRDRRRGRDPARSGWCHPRARGAERRVERLYADHGWASRVALADPAIRVPPANLQLDDYGWKGSASLLLPPFRWEPGTGVLLESTDAESFADAARAGGLPFSRRAVDGLALFVHAPPPSPGTRVPAGEIRVTASRNPKAAGLAVDGDPATRWGTAGPRVPGDWFRIDLPVPPAASRPPARGSQPRPTNRRPVIVESSLDGERWELLPATLRPERQVSMGRRRHPRRRHRRARARLHAGEREGAAPRAARGATRSSTGRSTSSPSTASDAGPCRAAGAPGRPWMRATSRRPPRRPEPASWRLPATP
jgi:hypothetical protein